MTFLGQMTKYKRLEIKIKSACRRYFRMTSLRNSQEKSRDIQASLSALRRSLVAESRILHLTQNEGSINNHRTSDTPRSEILARIENVIVELVKDISRGCSPHLSYPSTESWDDTRFDHESGVKQCPNTRLKMVKFESLNSVKRFGLMVKVLSIIYRLVKTGRFCTKRDIYYQEPDLFGNQRVLDHIVDNISCMLHVPRWDLHVLATSKGCIAGDLVFQDVDDNFIDCRKTTMKRLRAEFNPFPNNIVLDAFNLKVSADDNPKNVSTNAAFILVIEKDATFQKLLETRLLEILHPCILITGKGFPDMNTRMLLRKLWDLFTIPVLVLVDADPHGIEIMAVYKYGSKALSFDTDHLAVPSLKWLGVLPSDINRLNLPEQTRIPLNKADINKANELIRRPYIEHVPLWRREIELLLTENIKAEIQALDSLSDSFLSDVYIPSKIRCAGWI